MINSLRDADYSLTKAETGSRVLDYAFSVGFTRLDHSFPPSLLKGSQS